MLLIAKPSVLFKSIFVEPLESFVLLFVRLVFKTRRVDRFSTFSASPRRANNEKKRRVIFFHYFEFFVVAENVESWIGHLAARRPGVGLEFCVFTIFVFPTKFERLYEEVEGSLTIRVGYRGGGRNGTAGKFVR